MKDFSITNLIPFSDVSSGQHVPTGENQWTEPTINVVEDKKVKKKALGLTDLPSSGVPYNDGMALEDSDKSFYGGESPMDELPTSNQKYNPLDIDTDEELDNLTEEDIPEEDLVTEALLELSNSLKKNGFEQKASAIKNLIDFTKSAEFEENQRPAPNMGVPPAQKPKSNIDLISPDTEAKLINTLKRNMELQAFISAAVLAVPILPEVALYKLYKWYNQTGSAEKAIQNLKADMGQGNGSASTQNFQSATQSTNPRPQLKRVLMLGSKGEDVRILQGMLGNYYVGHVPGVFDQATKDSVIMYQNSRNLTPDGKVGKNTAAALGFMWTPTISNAPVSTVPNPQTPATQTPVAQTAPVEPAKETPQQTQPTAPAEDPNLQSDVEWSLSSWMHDTDTKYRAHTVFKAEKLNVQHWVKELGGLVPAAKAIINFNGTNLSKIKSQTAGSIKSNPEFGRTVYESLKEIYKTTKRANAVNPEGRQTVNTNKRSSRLNKLQFIKKLS